MIQLVYQLITLWISTITYVFKPANVWKIAVFLFRKMLLYSLFTGIAISVLLKYYMDFIPNMNQSVSLPFKEMKEEYKYYGFAFDRNYKMDLCETSEEMQFKFPHNETLTFERQMICNVIIHEEDNELEFEREFYQIWLRVQIKDQESVGKLKNIGVKAYLVYDNESSNVKFSAYMKLGDFYYSEYFKLLPLRVLVKIVDKMATFLDLKETVDREGELQLFSNIPINSHNSTVRMLVIQLSSSKELNAQGHLSLSPQLKGFRYFIYFYFWSSMAFGTISLLTIFIVLWEVILNIKVWKFIFNLARENISIW